MSIICLVLLCVIVVFMLVPVDGEGNNSYLHCSTVLYDLRGEVLADATLAACAAIMPPSASMPVSYFPDYNGTLVVTNQLSLNNIINVDEVDSVMEIDFFYRQRWIDPRWIMADEFWAGLDPRLSNTGMEIFPLFTGENREDPLPVWVPDAWFQDVMDMITQVSTLKLYPDGTLFYSRHLRLIIKQAHMDLAKYPLDYQLIDLKLLSYGLTAQHMKMVYDDPPIEYLIDSDGGINFGNNAIWEHKENYFNATIKTDDFVINGYQKTYETLHMRIYIERQGLGVLMRFAMPILILLILAGLTFWANFETRIDTSMTILLAVSALYVVILGSIPQVGYLTDFDVWIFNMFVMLSACVFAHQLVVNSFRKVEQWPFRAVMIRLIEMTGRVFIMPLCLLMFSETFQGDELSFFSNIYIRVPVLLGFLLLMIREAFGVKKAVKLGIGEILSKIEENKRKMSWWELFIINICYFNVIDFTTAPYKAKLKRMKRMNASSDGRSLELPTLNELHNLDQDDNDEVDPYQSRARSLSGAKGLGLRKNRRDSLYDSDDEL